MDYKTTKSNLEAYAELFAYITFINMKDNPLYKSVDINSIKGFEVYLFFNEYEPGDEPIIELNCRITINDSEKEINDIQIMYVQEEYFKALINKVYKSTGAFQYYEYNFGVPDQLKLYDAQFLIEEKLGIEGDS